MSSKFILEGKTRSMDRPSGPESRAVSIPSSDAIARLKDTLHRPFKWALAASCPVGNPDRVESHAAPGVFSFSRGSNSLGPGHETRPTNLDDDGRVSG